MLNADNQFNVDAKSNWNFEKVLFFMIWIVLGGIQITRGKIIKLREERQQDLRTDMNS